MGDDPKTVCPHVTTCSMFAIFTFAGTLDVWRDNYCHSEFSRCERWKRSQRGESVSPNLLPNGRVLRK